MRHLNLTLGWFEVDFAEYKYALQIEFNAQCTIYNARTDARLEAILLLGLWFEFTNP